MTNKLIDMLAVTNDKEGRLFINGHRANCDGVIDKIICDKINELIAAYNASVGTSVDDDYISWPLGWEEPRRLENDI